MGNCVSPAADNHSSKSETSTVTKEKKGKKVKLLLLGMEYTLTCVGY